MLRTGSVEGFLAMTPQNYHGGVLGRREVNVPAFGEELRAQR